MAGPGGGPGSPDYTVMGPACHQGLQDGEGKEATLWYGQINVRKKKEKNTTYFKLRPVRFIFP